MMSWVASRQGRGVIPKSWVSFAVLSRSNVDLEHYAGAIRHAVHDLPEKSGS